MKKSIVFSLIILLVLSVSPLLAGGGPPSRTEATRPVGTTPDDTNDGTGWDIPDIVSPDDFNDNIPQDDIVIVDDKDDSSLIEGVVISIIQLFSLEPIESE